MGIYDKILFCLNSIPEMYGYMVEALPGYLFVWWNGKGYIVQLSL